MEISPDGPSGIGGWLILPLIGVIVYPISISLLLINSFLPIFQEGIWQVLTTPGSEAYHKLWAPLIIYEITGNIVFILFSIFLALLFFSKSHRLPTLFIVYIALNCVFIVSDYAAGEFIPFVAEESDAESLGEVFRSIIAAAIWIPYFLASKRVKNTFVN